MLRTKFAILATGASSTGSIRGFIMYQQDDGKLPNMVFQQDTLTSPSTTDVVIEPVGKPKQIVRLPKGLAGPGAPIRSKVTELNALDASNLDSAALEIANNLPQLSQEGDNMTDWQITIYKMTALTERGNRFIFLGRGPSHFFGGPFGDEPPNA